MRGFKIDKNGDVVIENGDIVLVSDVELVAQSVRMAIMTNIGEWLYDKEEGIDFSVIFVKNPDYDLIRDTIKTSVQNVANNLGIKLETDNFTFDLQGRTLKVFFTLIYGDASTVIDVEL